LIYEHISKQKDLQYLLLAPNTEGRRSYLGVKGETPLHLAIRFSRSDILNTLLQNGACLKAAAKEKMFLLGEALKTHDMATMSTLIKSFKWDESENPRDSISLTSAEVATTWDLSNQNLESIVLPDAISIVQIDTIILSHNNLEKFPLDILKIQSLNNIVLTHNSIDEIGPKVGDYECVTLTLLGDHCPPKSWRYN
jgi:ankyrin repeat protein